MPYSACCWRYFGSLFEALRYTSAVNTGTLFTLVPLLTLFFEAVLMPDSSLRKRVAPMLLVAAGAVLLVLKGTGPDELPSLYAVLVYGIGCLAMALYSPLSQRLKVLQPQRRGPGGHDLLEHAVRRAVLAGVLWV